MPASQLEQTIAAFRQSLLAYDRRALNAVLTAYEPTRQAVLANINALLQLAQDNPGSDLFKLQRAQDLLAQIDTEMATLTAKIGSLVSMAQGTVMAQAGAYQQTLAVLSADTPALAAEISATWNRLPSNAFSDLVGRMSDGSPMSAWLDDFGAETSATLRTALLNGLAQGLSPSAVALELEQTTNVAKVRLAAMARTTMLDSFRSASLAQYADNSDILDGWIWTSAQDDTTCAACLALDGQQFGLDETFFAAHINCRCSPRPAVKGVDTAIRQSGADFFAGLTDKQQDSTLGQAGGAAYRDGTVSLQDFVQVQKSEQWGDRFTQGSLRGALVSASST